MKINLHQTFGMLLVVVSISSCGARVSLEYTCIDKWKYTRGSCWHIFNEANFCDAVEICKFYGSRISTDEIYSGKVSEASKIWTYNSSLTPALRNLSCSFKGADPGSSKDLCLVRLRSGSKVSTGCDSSAKFICSTKRHPVAIGLGNWAIKDDQLSSSSDFQSKTEPIGYKAKFGRLDSRFKVGSATQGGWCSNGTSANEYLEVNLGGAMLLTGLTIQGMQGRLCGHWVTMFNVSYKPAVGKWVFYENDPTPLTGNKNPHLKKKIPFTKPFIARSVRVNPVAFENNCKDLVHRFCLRLEIHGLSLQSFSDFPVKMSDRKPNFTKSSILIEGRRSSLLRKLQSDWPAGLYALPRPKTGCPSSDRWKYGYRLSDGITRRIPKNLTVSEKITINLRNTISPEYFVEEFCTKESPETREKERKRFPRGSYCIYKVHEHCPEGFRNGSLRFFENKTSISQSWSHVNGSVPKHFTNYNASDANCCFMEMHYCCRNDTTLNQMELPSSVPFYLIPVMKKCPDVANTNSTTEMSEVFIDKGMDDIGRIAFGLHPYVTISSSTPKAMQYHLCYYQPLATNSTLLKLTIHLRNHEINANFPFDNTVALLFNGSLIKHGEFSSIQYSTTALANCPVSNTDKSLVLKGGFGFYNGSVYPDAACADKTDVLITVAALVPRIGVVKAQVNVTMVSRVNIVIIVNDERIKKMPNLDFELSNVVKELETEADGGTRKIDYVAVSYRNANAIVTMLQHAREQGGEGIGQLHAMIDLDADDVQGVLASLTRVHDALLLTRRTSAINANANNRAILQQDTASPLHVTLLKLREMNITKMVLVRSERVKIPTSFAYHLQMMKFVVTKDIIISDRASTLDISNHLRALKGAKANIYFIVDHATSKRLFISAVKEHVSPTDGYNWISGSASGVFEHGIGSKDCYRHKPISCGEAFRGVIMMKGFRPVDLKTSFVDGKTSKLDSVTLNNATSYFRIELLRAMALDGVTAIVECIKTLSKHNVTITTSKLISLLEKKKPRRLDGLRFVSGMQARPPQIGLYNCLRGWSDFKCSLPVCFPYNCSKGKGKCVGDRLCECLSGTFGRSCSRLCQNWCKNGLCNDGAFGDGSCIACKWTHEGVFCEDPIVLKRIIFCAVSVTIVVMIIACYLLKFCRSKQNAVKTVGIDESSLITDWKELTNCEEAELQRTIVARHLIQKFRYTKYFKATLKEQQVFVKCIKKRSVKLSLDVRMEIKKVKQLDHVNIEKVKSICLGPPVVAIITELATMGSLYDTLHGENVEIPLEIKYAFMEDICQGMLYLHEKCSMSHGRLKSTNCLLYKGWRLKITDIGLCCLRKNTESSNCSRLHGKYKHNPEQLESLAADYNGLLWTAPEYLGPKIVNIDQVGKVQLEGDVYSFGILLVEILTRRPPYGEIKVMSTQHIIEAVAHMKEPMVDLEIIRPGSPKAGKEMLSKQGKTFRPSIRDSELPRGEPGKSMLRVLIESAWSEDPEGRPPFSHIKTLLRIIAPLKGDQMEKRAFLLEKETEALERYIAYDTRMISKEKEKMDDWRYRTLPPHIYSQIKDGEAIEATSLEVVSVAVFQIADFQDIVSAVSPDELIDLMDYLVKSFQAVACNQGLAITEMDIMSDLCVILSDGSSNATSADALLRFCITMQQCTSAIEIEYNARIKLRFSVAVHSDRGIAGMINDIGKTARYRVVSEVADIALKLLEIRKPNGILITQACADMIRNKDEISLVDTRTTHPDFEGEYRTYWVVTPAVE